MSKTIILMDNAFQGEFEIRQANDISDAKYVYQRRIEKEGKYWDRAYLVDDSLLLPVEEWGKEYDAKESKYERERSEAHEKSEFERLKKKYESI